MTLRMPLASRFKGSMAAMFCGAAGLCGPRAPLFEASVLRPEGVRRYGAVAGAPD